MAKRRGEAKGRGVVMDPRFAKAKVAVPGCCEFHGLGGSLALSCGGDKPLAHQMERSKDDAKKGEPKAELIRIKGRTFLLLDDILAIPVVKLREVMMGQFNAWKVRKRRGEG